MTSKEKVVRCRTDHPDWGYGKIANEVGLSKATVRFHLDDRIVNRHRVARKKYYKNRHPLAKKINTFVYHSRRHRERVKISETDITLESALDKFGESPSCYLTGDAINLNDMQSYSLDHIVPLSSDGVSNLTNMGLCLFDVNRAKSGLTVDQFVSLCRKVVAHAGVPPAPQP